MVQAAYIIDDDEISVYLTALVLEEAGFASEIRAFSSADEAIAQLPLTTQDPLPGVILLDLNMPEKSGWDFLDMLRPHEKSLMGKVAIFILTSSIANSDKDRSKTYPLVRGFIHKPLDDDSLRLILETLRAVRS